MVKVAAGEKSIVYQSIDLNGRPAVDCFRILTANERTATILNYGETEEFFRSIREWMFQLPTKTVERIYPDRENKMEKEGICRDEDVAEMLKQFLDYKRRFTPLPSAEETKIIQMEWGQ